MKLTVKASSPYDFRSVVFSHGWSDLLPFKVLNEQGKIRVTVRTKENAVVLQVSDFADGIQVETDAKKLNSDTISTLRRMFRLDDDLSDFYQHVEINSRNWIVQRRMGRLLRSQTIFEDLVKLILTTNCSWSLTRVMTDSLSKYLGSGELGMRLFPTPEAIVSKPESFFRQKIRAGYRSPHLPLLAKMVLEGKLIPESWEDPSRPTEVVRKEILSVPGAGPYVADNLLKFLGRYDYLGLDSWARGKLKELWGMKKIPSDKTIERRYKIHRKYKGLVLWCDLTKDWFERNEFEAWIRRNQNENH